MAVLSSYSVVSLFPLYRKVDEFEEFEIPPKDESMEEFDIPPNRGPVKAQVLESKKEEFLIPRNTRQDKALSKKFFQNITSRRLVKAQFTSKAKKAVGISREGIDGKSSYFFKYPLFRLKKLNGLKEDIVSRSKRPKDLDLWFRNVERINEEILDPRKEGIVSRRKLRPKDLELWFRNVKRINEEILDPKLVVSKKMGELEEFLREGKLHYSSVNRYVQMEGEIISDEIGEKQIKQHGDASSSSSSLCIFRTPFPELEFQKPRLVSIGPYHWDEDLPLEKYKYFFLDKFMSQTGKDLSFYVQDMMTLQWSTRRCYSEDLSMSSPEFIEMMLVDSCFIVEVLRHFGRRNDELKDRIVFPIEPWQTPILAQDLLMLENQIPFFVLERLFDISESEDGKAALCVTTMALQFFDLAFPGHMDLSCKPNHFEADHLLDLFLKSICPTNRSPIQSQPSSSKGVKLEQQIDPPFHSISVKELQTSDIQFRPKRANRFTDINFKVGVLEIPPITVNDHFIAILINCMAFEHCSMRRSKDLTAYVSFMSSLIRDPTDAKLLCSNGIISAFSNDDRTVADSFYLISKFISNLDIQDSYLSGTLKAIENYHTTIGKTRWWRRFFMRHSWISLFCIANFLFAFNRLRPVVCLMIHYVKETFTGDDIDNTCVWPPSKRHNSIAWDSVFIIVESIQIMATSHVTSLVLDFCFQQLPDGDLVRFWLLRCWNAVKKWSQFGLKGKEAKLFENMSYENPEAELHPVVFQGASSGSSKLRRDPSLSEDELKEEMRLQSQTHLEKRKKFRFDPME